MRAFLARNVFSVVSGIAAKATSAFWQSNFRTIGPGGREIAIEA